MKLLLGLDEEAGDGLVLPREPPEVEQLPTVLACGFQVLLVKQVAETVRIDRIRFHLAQGALLGLVGDQGIEED